MKRNITLVAVVLVIVLFLVAISFFVKKEPENVGGSKGEETAPRQFTVPAKTSGSANGSGFSIYSIAITAQGFDPHEVVVRRGGFAQFDITNATGAPVDVKADVIGLYIPSVQPSEKTGISLEASKNAEIEVVCYKLCPEGVKLLGRFIIQE